MRPLAVVAYLVPSETSGNGVFNVHLTCGSAVMTSATS